MLTPRILTAAFWGKYCYPASFTHGEKWSSEMLSKLVKSTQPGKRRPGIWNPIGWTSNVGPRPVALLHSWPLLHLEDSILDLWICMSSCHCGVGKLALLSPSLPAKGPLLPDISINQWCHNPPKLSLDLGMNTHIHTHTFHSLSSSEWKLSSYHFLLEICHTF